MTTLPPAAAAAGDLDEFQLVRVLGHGGMGSVYLGYDTVLERDVAIKLLRDHATDDDARLRFLTEARAIARLDHPNVIAIFRASTTRDGHPYLVQELVRGKSLDRLTLPLDPGRTLAIGLGLARGLAAAHRRGILHRDVKPANVMIDDDGTPKLLDFGVAKLSRRERPAVADPVRTERSAEPHARRPEASEPQRVGRDGRGGAIELDQTLRAASTVAETLDPDPCDPPAEPPVADAAPTRAATAAGAIVGTPRYMAPEIWRGEPATVRSDLYSFGAVLYELAAGRAPHPQGDRASLEAAVLAGPPPRPIAELAPELDAALAEIIMACLAREPARRPESADEIAHRIDRIVGGAPPVPDGNPYPGLAPFADEHRAVFYGRGTDITTVIDRLRSAPLVVVAGDSGIGKSSLCRAGVLPAVRAGALGDRRRWQVRSVLVGRHAAAALRDALGWTGTAAELSLGEAIHAVGATRDTGLLVFLDQFEELVTLTDPAEAAEAATLLASLARGVPGLKILIAVRGDFLTRVAGLPALGALMTHSLHLLRALGPGDARDIVVGPARAKGVEFETPALVEALASSIADQPGALPLLSFALAELWQRRDAPRAIIPAAALADIGGVAGGLARHADAVIGALTGPERIAARRIALRLITHDDTRAARDRSELCPDDEPAASAALEAMIRGRLVVARNTASGAPVYELAHDSLIAAWSMLRGWRDDVAGQRGLRTRLAAAADEWRRLGRGTAPLWNRAQLDEASRLDELSGGERAFLAASRRAVRRRRFAAIALAASLPAVAAATGLVIQRRDHAARDRGVAAQLTTAAAQLGEATAMRAAALADRDTAFARFDHDDFVGGELLWSRARAQITAARTAYAAASGALEAALLIDGARADVRARMARVIFDQATLAELTRDRDAAHELAVRLAAVDRGGALAAAWLQPATLAVDVPGAVAIEVRAYVDHDGRLELGAPVHAAAGSRLTGSLPAGSYQIELRGHDGLIVRSPILAARGEALRIAFPLPRAADLPAGMAYIPAGRFLVGSGAGDDQYRRDFLVAAPLHTATTAAYLIGITEVTFGDWISYLRALPPAERERRRPDASVMNGATVRLDGGRAPGEPFTLMIKPLVQLFVAREGEPLRYPGRTRRAQIRWEAAPVSGISLDDARAYVAWLASTGRVPGARLCSELEWERGARGADGRTWAHGERVDPDDANVDITYGRVALGYGPDEVGAHPRSTSPFGLADTVGNSWEWVEPPPGTGVLRGGCWYQGFASAVVTNRDFIAGELRSTWSGLRICATPK